MRRQKKLIARLFMLAVLLSCLGFVALTPNTQTVLAAPCCSTCPLPPPGEITPEEFCADQCQGQPSSCYQNCLNSVYNCWAHCSISC